jgi:hypothetical protein
MGAGRRSGPRAFGSSARSSMRPRGVTGHRSQAGRGRQPHAGARPAREIVRRPRYGTRCRRSAAHAPAGGTARWSIARGSGVPHVDASEASGAGAEHGSPASPRDRQRPGGATSHAAAWRLLGHQTCRVWRCPQGWRSSRGQAHAHRACLREHRGQPAKTTSRGLRRSQPKLSGRARWS